ncbi:ammonium transporter [Marinivivus vitaminiproducens]|uniref:ammonium transporter n=1 Tax=Marinivivus vitaminiproducens TaxID=3035935 RepID=UPI0027997B2E|nr:ammonium transporter [Geminicoccaceae bacterium SCSIO 64248]
MSRVARSLLGGFAVTVGSTLTAASAFAQDAGPAIDTGDTAWMMISTAIVLMMTIPGLALFYAGMVRKKNILATMMQSFAICGLISIVWMVVGYSLAFGEGGAYVGDLSRLFLAGLVDSWDAPFTLGSGDAGVAFTIPESVFVMFQMTFAIITAALITGAVADRMRFSALVAFVTLWSILIYSPIAHWVWHPNGFLFGWGALDFAGGTVVHINAGIAGLVASYVLGKRVGYGSESMVPFNLGLAVIGASLLWVGWFGFNAGSAGAAGARAGMAMLVTQLAAAAAALAWMAAEWMVKGKPSVLGAISGAVAGLVAITPASGFVIPSGALIIGIVAGVLCFWSAAYLKHLIGADDSLDVFGVHGVGGIIGALLTGLLSYGALTASDAAPEGFPGLFYGGGAGQFVIQIEAVAITLLYSGIGTFILLKIIDVVIGLRVAEDQEREGLDVTLHGEQLG